LTVNTSANIPTVLTSTINSESTLTLQGTNISIVPDELTDFTNTAVQNISTLSVNTSVTTPAIYFGASNALSINQYDTVSISWSGPWQIVLSGTMTLHRLGSMCTLYLKAIESSSIIEDTPMTVTQLIPSGYLPISDGEIANFTVPIVFNGVLSLDNLTISTVGKIIITMIQPTQLQSGTVVGSYAASCAGISGLIPSSTTVGFANSIYVSYLCAV
jgi:hypothetical protein